MCYWRFDANVILLRGCPIRSWTVTLRLTCPVRHFTALPLGPDAEVQALRMSRIVTVLQRWGAGFYSTNADIPPRYLCSRRRIPACHQFRWSGKPMTFAVKVENTSASWKPCPSTDPCQTVSFRTLFLRLQSDARPNGMFPALWGGRPWGIAKHRNLGKKCLCHSRIVYKLYRISMNIYSF